MGKRIFICIIIVVVIIGGLGAVKVLQFKKMMAGAASFKAPPETVSSAVAREETWQQTMDAIGSVAAVQGVQVTTDTPGLVKEIAFDSGSVVKKGDLLVKLDTTSEEAQLRAMEAQAEWASITQERNLKLRKENAISQADLDSSEAALKQAQANRDATRTIIEKKTIRAPFDGQIGIRQINLGQYLEAGKPIVSLQSLTPVYVDFSLPQHFLANLKTGMKVRATTDAYPKRNFEGEITAINPDLDPNTRSVAIRASFSNQDQALRPGMYARVQVLMPETKPVLVIPATAILSAPFGDSVYVIEPQKGNDGKGGLAVRQQFVKTGESRGDLITVTTGLKAGEKVVSAGVFKLRNSMPVVENNDLVPKAEANPRPPDA